MKAKTRYIAPAFGLTLLLSVAAFAPAFAATAPFIGELPAFGGHASLTGADKSNPSSTIAQTWVNEGVNGGIFWVDRDGYSQVTDGYTIQPGRSATMPYYNSSWWTGSCTLRGATILWKPTPDYTSGRVDFG